MRNFHQVRDGRNSNITINAHTFIPNTNFVVPCREVAAPNVFANVRRINGLNLTFRDNRAIRIFGDEYFLLIAVAILNSQPDGTLSRTWHRWERRGIINIGRHRGVAVDHFNLSVVIVPSILWGRTIRRLTSGNDLQLILPGRKIQEFLLFFGIGALCDKRRTPSCRLHHILHMRDAPYTRGKVHFHPSVVEAIQSRGIGIPSIDLRVGHRDILFGRCIQAAALHFCREFIVAGLYVFDVRVATSIGSERFHYYTRSLVLQCPIYGEGGIHGIGLNRYSPQFTRAAGLGIITNTGECRNLTNFKLTWDFLPTVNIGKLVVSGWKIIEGMFWNGWGRNNTVDDNGFSFHLSFIEPDFNGLYRKSLGRRISYYLSFPFLTAGENMAHFVGNGNWLVILLSDFNFRSQIATWRFQQHFVFTGGDTGKLHVICRVCAGFGRHDIGTRYEVFNVPSECARHVVSTRRGSIL